MKSVVIYGPQGIGKTKHAEALREHFGLHTVLDGVENWEKVPTEGHLILTNELPKRQALRVLHFDVVAKYIGLVDEVVVEPEPTYVPAESIEAEQAPEDTKPKTKNEKRRN